MKPILYHGSPRPIDGGQLRPTPQTEVACEALDTPQSMVMATANRSLATLYALKFRNAEGKNYMIANGAYGEGESFAVLCNREGFYRDLEQQKPSLHVLDATHFSPVILKNGTKNGEWYSNAPAPVIETQTVSRAGIEQLLGEGHNLYFVTPENLPQYKTQMAEMQKLPGFNMRIAMAALEAGGIVERERINEQPNTKIIQDRPYTTPKSIETPKRERY